MKPTNHKDINDILQILRDGLVNILDDNLVGLYLTGSLTYGGFDRGTSDIDFLVVLRKELSTRQRNKVEDLQSNIGVKYPEWHKRLEGSYITREMLTKVEPPEQARPYANAGKMGDSVYGNEWIIDLYQLYERGISLIGPTPKEFMQPVDINDVREASRKNLLEEWKPKLSIPAPFQLDDYDRSHLQAYAVMTMCRILHTARNEDIVPKNIASAWAKDTYGKRWRGLIEKAENWKHGNELNLENEIKDFIEFTIEQVEAK